METFHGPLTSDMASKRLSEGAHGQSDPIPQRYEAAEEMRGGQHAVYAGWAPRIETYGKKY